MARILYLALGAILSGISPVEGAFTLYNSTFLDVTLGEGCISALSSSIECLDYVKLFTQPTYRGSLNNDTLTDLICATGCSASLKSWFDSVAVNCEGKLLNNALPTKFGGYIWAGFNETCLKDPVTGDYCNDIIDEFSLVSDITEMPQTELCHPCHINRLAMMQSSQYSTYDGFWKEQLEYVYEHCSVTGPTEIPPPLLPPQPEPEPYCLTGQWYTTQAGNTCESIANATNVSGASLYMGNQDLIKNCLDIDAGVEVCIPLTCQTYYVQPSDTCVTIELAKGIGLGSLMKYNSWIDAACTNLQQATEFYGKVICLGPAGGEWTGTSPETPTGPQPNDGYSDDVTPPPDGAVVADGTTLNCGKWHVVGGEDSCPSICLEEGITAALFRMVNPSLDPEDCTETLQVGAALCVGPTYRWNSTESTELSTTITLDPTATETSSSTSSTAPAVTTPTPIQPGMVDNCNAFYFVTSGQGCAEVASINGISLADFYTWNPAVGSTCGGLWAEVYVCVGVTGTTPTTPTPTPTSPGNGISTPTPTLPGMVDNCNVFHKVVSGDGCWDLANSAGISLADFYAWNPQAAPDCAGLWLDYYVCLGRL